MSNIPKSTRPKPFIFVLMPFDPEYDDIYKFGIKGAANEVGAYVERLDEQIFSEGMLDRIFNQISRADVIVADMTGRNPNVFYEVGYAHALGKIVILLTQATADIPFDLKHRQHTAYGGSIEKLKKELIPRLQWAIAESRRISKGELTEILSLKIFDIDLALGLSSDTSPSLEGPVKSRYFSLPIQLRNDSIEPLSPISHVYLFTNPSTTVVPFKNVKYESSFGGAWVVASTGETTSFYQQPLDAFTANPLDSQDNLTSQYRLPITFQELPAGAVEIANIDFMFLENYYKCDFLYRIRLHTRSSFYDFSYRLKLDLDIEEKEKSNNEDS